MHRHPYDDVGGHSAKVMFSARDAAHCLSLCLGLLVVACTGSPRTAPIFFESEPNDDFLSANPLGAVFPGEQLFIRGDISAAYPDPADGFALLAAVDCDIEIILRAAPGADLDLHVYDPVRDEFVFSFQSPFDPELGYFGVLGPRTEFHLVVTSASIASVYELELRCHSPTFAVSADAGPIVPLPREGLNPPEPSVRVQPKLDAYRLLDPREDRELGSSPWNGFWVEIDASGEVRSGPLVRGRGGLVALP